MTAAAIEAEERAHAEELGDRFVYLPDGPKEYEGKAGIIAALQTAVMSHGVLRYAYESEHRVSHGLMTPFSLVVYKHGLYLAARRLKSRAQAKRLRLPDDYSDPYAKLFAVERLHREEEGLLPHPVRAQGSRGEGMRRPD